MPTQRVEDFNGWFEVARNPISKVGVFPYLGSSLGPEMLKEQGLDPNKVYMVYRSAEALSDPEFIASCRLLPWVDEHTMLGGEDSGYTPAEQKGTGGVTGEQVEFDESDGTLYSNIKLFSEAQKNEIDNGKRELSLGYRCQYFWQPGSFNGENYDLIQRNLRGNHLASVDEGRMGSSVAVLDHNDIKGASTMDEINKLLAALAQAIAAAIGAPPAIEPVEDEDPEVPAEDEDPEVPAEDEDPEVPAAKPADAASAAAKPADAAKPVVGAADDTAAAGAADDTAAADAVDAPVTAEAMDAAVNARVLAQFKAIQRGAALATKLKPHVGVFDHSGKTEAQIAAYGVKKLGLNVDKGTEVASLKGWLLGKGDPSKAATVRNSMVNAQDSADNKPSLIDKKLAERSKA